LLPNSPRKNGSVVAEKETVAPIDPPGAALVLDGEGREIQKSVAMSLRSIRARGRIGRARGEKR
jgi:hypothetical protein